MIIIGALETLLSNVMEDIKLYVKKSLDELVASVVEPWVSKSEIAKHLNRSETYVSERLSVIPHIKDDKGYPRFKKSHIDKWLIEEYGRNYEGEEQSNKAPVVKTSNNKRAWEPIK